MRQAGRYLPEYRAIKDRFGFWEMVRTPEIAAEVTLQPLRRFDLDAAILFSDIMTPLTSAGIQIEFNPGPCVTTPIRSHDAIRRLRLPHRSAIAPFVVNTIKMVREESVRPLIGFAGAPLTLAAYLVEGGGSADYGVLKRWLHDNTPAAHDLLRFLSDLTTRYLHLQIEAGVQAVQIFDSWAGIHSVRTYDEFGLPYLKQILAALDGTGVPRIYLAVGAAHLYRQIRTLPIEVISVDWRTPLDECRTLFPGKTLQGNLDPALLLASSKVVTEETRRTLRQGLGGPHIFNLGHGVLATTPPDNVARIVDIVHAYTRTEDDVL
jgi:uroporphyrinogen decarboxylase